MEKRLDAPGPVFRWNELPDDLDVFFQADTLKELCALRAYFGEEGANKETVVDQWIQMVATNRLTGHSKGFFSVYTLPPNQAVTVDRQRLINSQSACRQPEYRDVKALILKKEQIPPQDPHRRKTIESFKQYGRKSRDCYWRVFRSSGERHKTGIRGPGGDLASLPRYRRLCDPITGYAVGSISLDANAIPISIHRNIESWSEEMTATFKRMVKLLKKGAYVAFEVGEVRKGKIKLEDHVIPAAERAGLVPILVLVNDQEFTKTSNCWGRLKPGKGNQHKPDCASEKAVGLGKERLPGFQCSGVSMESPTFRSTLSSAWIQIVGPTHRLCLVEAIHEARGRYT